MQKVPQFLKENMQNSLCWYCAKCTDCNSCSWVNGTPIEGWTVVEEGDGVTVKDCPNFGLSRRFNASLPQLSALLNVGVGSVRYMLRSDLHRIEKLINRKGFELEIICSDYENRKGRTTVVLKKRRNK